MANVYDIPAHERVSQMWMNVDDVLKRLPVSRSQFWQLIKRKEFPAPHYHHKTPLWSQRDLAAFIERRVRELPTPTSSAVPVTWALIAALMRDSYPSGLTNKQIAFSLGADYADVASLTRIMAKAGELSAFNPTRIGNGGPLFYTAKSNA